MSGGAVTHFEEFGAGSNTRFHLPSNWASSRRRRHKKREKKSEDALNYVKFFVYLIMSEMFF